MTSTDIGRGGSAECLDSGESGARLTALVRRFPLTAFLVWFFTVGQAIAFIPLIARVVYGVDLQTAPFLITAAFVGLLLPAVVITWIADGREGLRVLRQRAVAFGVPARWYALAVVGVPLISLAAIAPFAGWPEQMNGSALTVAFTVGPVLQLAVVFVTVNWAEEIAWMGFFQARMQRRHGPVLAAVVTGPVFAFGHISQLIEDSLAATLSLLTLMVVVCIPFRALLGWIYNHTGSLVLVGLVHAAANATAAGSILGTGLLDRLYPGQGHGGVVIPLLAVVGLVVLTATRGRLGLLDPGPDSNDPRSKRTHRPSRRNGRRPTVHQKGFAREQRPVSTKHSRGRRGMAAGPSSTTPAPLGRVQDPAAVRKTSTPRHPAGTKPSTRSAAGEAMKSFEPARAAEVETIAAGPPPSEMSAVVTAMMRTGRVPGLSVAVVTRDRMLLAGGYGFADLSATTPAVASTAYLWFSMTKVVTATAALRLGDEGRLDLDAPVGDYVDYLRAPGHAQPSVRQLLSHTAGLGNPLPIRWAHPADAPQPGPEVLLRRVMRDGRGYRHRIGQTVRYSNVGYLALGQIIAAAAGMPFQDYVERAVLRPVGMDHTGFRYPTVGDRATGYLKAPSITHPLLRRVLPQRVAGDRQGRYLALNSFYVDGPAYGGLVGNVLDAGRFLRMHLGDGEIDGHRVLDPQTARRMRSIEHSGKPFDHGTGWFRRPTTSGASRVEHYGTGVGFWNVMRLYPDRGLGIVIMSNSTTGYDFEPLCTLLTGATWS